MMKRNVFNWMAVLALVCSLVSIGHVAAQQIEAVDRAPRRISYQGYVSVDGVPYNGAGYFKFAVVNSGGDTSYWSNDGTSTAGGQPTSGVALTVSNGLFNVLLGDAPMVSLGAGAFEGPDRALRVWFSSDGGASYTQLVPDRKIASVPYALQAEEAAHAASADDAANADLLDGLDSDDLQKAIDVYCEPGFAVVSITPGGGAYCAPAEQRPAFTASTIESTYSPLFPNSAITMGTDGMPLLLLVVYLNEHLTVILRHCNNAACADTRIGVISVVGPIWPDGDMPALTIGADGFPLIAYYENSSDNLVVVHCQDYACSQFDSTRVDVTGSVGEYASIAVGVDGLGIVSYYDESNSNLKVAHCENIACTSYTVRDLVNAPGADVGLYTSLTILADGMPLISYYDATNDLLRTVHCLDVACSTANSPVLMYEGGGEYSSITTGADGFGLLSFYDSTHTDLGVVHCNNYRCTDITLSMPDMDPGVVGMYTSITTGADGLGLISYYDYTNKDLKVAHCSNTACSSAVTSTVDSAGDVGYFNSITIGQDGLGLISYWDNTNNTIKVLHLSNLFGLPYVRRR